MKLLCHTKIAGTMSGPTAVARQSCLKFIQRVLDLPCTSFYTDDGRMRLILEPEPDNPHDPDAIKVLFEYRNGEYFHLGYIPNADSICRECGTEYERWPVNCRVCENEEVERIGTATRLRSFFAEQEDGGGLLNAFVEEVTGGGEKALGCNISIWAEE